MSTIDEMVKHDWALDADPLLNFLQARRVELRHQIELATHLGMGPMAPLPIGPELDRADADLKMVTNVIGLLAAAERESADYRPGGRFPRGHFRPHWIDQARLAARALAASRWLEHPEFRAEWRV